jgi:hypothetical protein
MISGDDLVFKKILQVLKIYKKGKQILNEIKKSLKNIIKQPRIKSGAVLL